MVTCYVRSPLHCVSTVWDLIGPLSNSPSVEDEVVPLFPETRDIEWEPSVSSDTSLGCGPVMGVFVTALGLWMSRPFPW